MSSVIVMISAAFLAAGIAYGRVVGTIKSSNDVLGMITKSWASLASLLFLFLLIAQFIAYFDFSNMAQVAAIWLGDILEELDLGDLWLLLGVMVVTILVNFLIPAKIAKWAILAPIFVPLMLRLGVEPQTMMAAYRVGDSPTNVLTPLMPYFALMVVFAQRYQRDAGIGTVIALMIPYTLILTVAWTLFFVAWYLIGIPVGPGWPIR
jgi:aminobenzoyl-glutamate transport protein